MNPSTDGEREPFVVPAFLAHTTASAAMALAHLDPYRRSRRDAARALARTARRCAAHPSSSPRRSSRAPSTASAGEGSATRVLEWARTCSHHQSTLDVELMALSKGLIRPHGRWRRLHGAATDHHTLGSRFHRAYLKVQPHSSRHYTLMCTALTETQRVQAYLTQKSFLLNFLLNV